MLMINVLVNTYLNSSEPLLYSTQMQHFVMNRNNILLPSNPNIGHKHMKLGSDTEYTAFHYENTPIQIYGKFHLKKKLKMFR